MQNWKDFHNIINKSAKWKQIVSNNCFLHKNRSALGRGNFELLPVYKNKENFLNNYESIFYS